MENRRNVECRRCGYVWETASDLVYVNCPSCRTAVKIREVGNGEKAE